MDPRKRTRDNTGDSVPQQWGGSDQGHRHKRNKSASASGGSSVHDDTVGHIDARPGDFVGEFRYLSEGGMGTFGKVLMCEEPKGGRLVAVKVVRRVRKYVESARTEAEILEDVARADPHQASGCVRLLHWFDWRGHFCMVFEPLGKSLYEYAKANKYRPMPLYCVQSMADQLVGALAFLHAMNLVHTDIKLENVLLVNREPFQVTDKATMRRGELREKVLAPARTAIKLIDFGGASYDDGGGNVGIINTRQYRSPEVILGMPWGLPSDVWSLGCLLMELYTGVLLFNTVRAAGALADGGPGFAAPPSLARARAHPPTHHTHTHAPARAPLCSTTMRSTSPSLTPRWGPSPWPGCGSTPRTRYAASSSSAGACASPRARAARRASAR